MKVTIKNVKKSFHKQLVIDIDHLEIGQGVTGLIGDNGTGKTTLLNIIAGILKSDDGEVLYNDEKFSKEIYQELTLVYQHPYMLNRNVYDNIAYPLTLRKKSKDHIKLKTNRLMNDLNISHLEHKNANSLSGGEKQKVALARALACEPKILLLDEPTSNIDKASKLIIEEEIIKFAKQGNIAIIVSHDEKQISRICDQCIQLTNLSEM